MDSTATSPLPVQTLSVPGQAALTLRVLGRKPRSGALPLVLHFHGGAFVSGDLDSGACLAELLAGSGAVVASLAYPLAPEHRFPEALEAGLRLSVENIWNYLAGTPTHVVAAPGMK